MKNMKKILAVGALLTLGTMAVAATAADFKVNLEVVAPLEISRIRDVNFPELNLSTTPSGKVETTAEEDKGKFVVTGARGLGVDITVTRDALLTVNGGTATVPFNLEIQNSDGTKISDGDVAITLDTNGTYTGLLSANFMAENVTKTGVYEGDVTLEVAFN